MGRTKKMNEKAQQYIGEYFHPKYQQHKLPGAIHPDEPTSKETNAKYKPRKITIEG